MYMSTIPDTQTTSYAAIAQQMTQVAHEVVSRLDGFVYLSPGERLRVNTSANIPDKFLETIARAMDRFTALAASTSLTSAEIRDLVAWSQAWLSVADEFIRLARGIKETVKRRRAIGGTESLRVYSVAKHLNRPGDREELVPWVDQLQQALGRGRRKPDKPAAPPPNGKQAASGGAA